MHFSMHAGIDLARNGKRELERCEEARAARLGCYGAREIFDAMWVEAEEVEEELCQNT
jgi:hypothetical protein